MAGRLAEPLFNILYRFVTQVLKMASEAEVMLAQEQGVRMRGVGERKGIEGGFGGELEGTLVLTNHRLIFVCTNEQKDNVREGPGMVMRLVYSDVEDLASIPKTDDNLFIPLTSITTVKGHSGRLERPSLAISWHEADETRGRVFIERLTGRSRRKNLGDWASTIERLKAGIQKITPLPQTSAPDSIDGKIMRVLGDMQRKGLFEIEEEAEKQFKIKLDPDEVQAACERLSKNGLLDRLPDKSGDTYYQKRSPLGDGAL